MSKGLLVVSTKGRRGCESGVLLSSHAVLCRAPMPAGATPSLPCRPSGGDAGLACGCAAGPHRPHLLPGLPPAPAGRAAVMLRGRQRQAVARGRRRRALSRVEAGAPRAGHCRRRRRGWGRGRAGGWRRGRVGGRRDRNRGRDRGRGSGRPGSGGCAAGGWGSSIHRSSCRGRSSSCSWRRRGCCATRPACTGRDALSKRGSRSCSASINCANTAGTKCRP